MKNLSLNDLTNYISETEIQRTAVNAGFYRRRATKISPVIFLMGCCISALNTSFSFSSLASAISLLLRKKTVSDTAVWKRIGASSSKFMKQVLCKIMMTKVSSDITGISDILVYFKRIILVDSTSVGLNDKLINKFPGSSNQNKKSSGLKIQAAVDIINNVFVYFELSPFTKNDQKAAHDVIEYVKKGDLIIRDLGYFVIETFKTIIQVEAFFISRLKYGVALYYPDTGDRIKISDLIRNHKVIDTEVFLGSKHKLKVRLTGVKLPENKAAEKRRKYKKNRDKRLNPSKEHMLLLGWNLSISNIDKNILSPKEILAVYCLRWRIEIIFKSWKSNLNFNLSKNKFSEEQLNTLIYSRLVVITLLGSYYFSFNQKLIGKNIQLSLLKFIKFIIDNRFILLYDTLKHLTGHTINMVCQKICSYEKRKRKNYQEKIKNLSIIF